MTAEPFQIAVNEKQITTDGEKKWLYTGSTQVQNDSTRLIAVLRRI